MKERVCICISRWSGWLIAAYCLIGIVAVALTLGTEYHLPVALAFLLPFNIVMIRIIIGVLHPAGSAKTTSNN